VSCGNPDIRQLQRLMLHHHAVWPEFLSCVSHKAVLAEVLQPEQKLLSQDLAALLQMALEDKNSRQRTTWRDVGFLQQASNHIAMTEYFSTNKKTNVCLHL